MREQSARAMAARAQITADYAYKLAVRMRMVWEGKGHAPVAEEIRVVALGRRASPNAMLDALSGACDLFGWGLTRVLEREL
jgi:hypothetical protein